MPTGNEKPRIAIRADGGASIGLGHIRRCVTLARALHGLGADVCFFLGRDGSPAHVLNDTQTFSIKAVERGEARHLDETIAGLAKIKACGLVVDSYDVSPDALARVPVPLAVIVDQPPRAPLPADLLISGGAAVRDQGFASLPGTKLLIGPKYVLLRTEFSVRHQRIIRERVERILVTTGGGDQFNLSPLLVRLIHDVLDAVAVDVIVGPYFSPETLGAIEHLAMNGGDITLHRDPSDVWSLMLECDMAVTGGGQTTYELAATGTPAVAVLLADNQRRNLEGLAAEGALLWAGDAREPGVDGKLSQALMELAFSRDAREQMSRAGRRLVDGRGAIRVAEEVLQLCCERQRQ